MATLYFGPGSHEGRAFEITSKRETPRLGDDGTCPKCGARHEKSRNGRLVLISPPTAFARGSRLVCGTCHATAEGREVEAAADVRAPLDHDRRYGPPPTAEELAAAKAKADRKLAREKAKAPRPTLTAKERRSIRAEQVAAGAPPSEVDAFLATVEPEPEPDPEDAEA